jgi:hypothetical protein
MAASVPGGNLIVLGVILILTALYLRHGIFGALMALARRVTGDRT